MPKFSIIITVFNKEKYIFNTITSVLNQSIQDFELIIINDGSTDNSLSIIENFNDDRIQIHTLSNSGPAAARNNGIKKAQGNYIALLDGDDLWHPFFLEEISLLIKTYPKASVFATALEFEINKHLYPANYSISELRLQLVGFFEGSQSDSILSSSSITIKASVFDDIGYFNESYTNGEDTDYWVRIGLYTSIAFSNKICVRYINVKDSLSNKSLNLTTTCNFDDYITNENSNAFLKKFLDLNRYSLAIQSKTNNEIKAFLSLKSKIDIESLNQKQRFLMQLPSKVLRCLFQVKSFLKNKGLAIRVFD